MASSINIPSQPSNQRDENFRKWKAKSFPTHNIPLSYDHPKKMMDKELYNYAAEDEFEELFDHLWCLPSMELSSIIYSQVSPSGNSLLHVSASHGMKDVTELLLQHFPLLMTGENFHEDTALHLAAGAGQLETTAILINKAKGHGEANDFRYILEMKNDRGNTALHEAVINRHHDVARFLVSEWSELCYTENKDHESPLYHAVENSDKEMLSILMLAIPHHDVDLLKNLKGKSPVHAAVQGRKREILEQIAKEKPDLLRQEDEQGENPLHCAASLGYVLETQFLLKKYRDGAIQTNNEGNMPIHVASKEGHVGVVDAYNSEWSDLTEFLNTKRQNILHVAAERGRNEVVKHILESKTLEALINKQDLDGNTPLHLASMNGRSIATFYLVRNSMVVKDKGNGENLTPYEIAEKQSKIVGLEFSGEQIPKGKGNQVGPDDSKGGEGILDYYGALMTLSVLHFWVSPKKRKVEYSRIESRLPEDEIKGRMRTLLVVSVLIASVTFAGVLQLPKSTDQPERIASNITTNSIQNQGISENEGILRNVYIYFDMVALNASVMASIILCWAQLYDLKFAPFVIWFSSLMVGGAIYMMCLAFFFAVIIALGGSDYRVLALIIIVAGSVFFLAQTLLYLQWILPPSVNQILERKLSYHVYYLSFLLLFHSSRWLSELKRGRTSSGSDSGVDS